LHVPRGGVLFHRGDPCIGFHLVVYGQVMLAFTSPQGGEKVVEIIGPGYSFGEALMFIGKAIYRFRAGFGRFAAAACVEASGVR
jgi:CRP-like cAMP-binding protein